MYCSILQFGELAKLVLNTGSSLRFQATGWSMHPAMQDGDRLLIAPLSGAELKRGDVVLAWLEGDRPVVHRIVRVRRHEGVRWLLLKGDRVAAADGWLRADAVLGKVSAIERGGASIALGGRWGRLAGYLLAAISPLNLWRYRFARATPWLLVRLASSGQNKVQGAV